MARAKLWYTRCGTQIRGPFHAGLIRHYLLLGRLSAGDEVSADKQTWTPIAGMTEFTGPVGAGQGDDPTVRERLLAAKRWADERLGQERREREAQAGHERRERDERREEEPESVLRHRRNRTRRTSVAYSGAERLGIFLVLVIGGVFVGLIFLVKPHHGARGPDCTAPPAPGVNWANCHLDGMHLSAVDLRGANLHNADLSGVDLSSSNLAGADLAFARLRVSNLRGANLYRARLKGADLTEANLRGADLRGADLSYAILRRADLTSARLKKADLFNAIWVDNAVCGAGSRGGCRAGGPSD